MQHEITPSSRHWFTILRPERLTSGSAYSTQKHGIINFIIEEHVLVAANIDLCLDLFLPKYSSQ